LKTDTSYKSARLQVLESSTSRTNCGTEWANHRDFITACEKIETKDLIKKQGKKYGDKNGDYSDATTLNPY